MNSNNITLIFDVDGTLVDVSKSYNQTIIQTAYIYCKKILGWTELPILNKWFNEDFIIDLKNLPGFNNDYICTTTLIDFLLTVSNIDIRKINSNIPYLPLSFKNIFKGDIYDYRDEWKKYIDRSFKTSENWPVDVLKNSKYFNLLRFEGQIYQGNYIERIFQELYYGKDKFENNYKTKTLYIKEDHVGFHKLESLLIPISLLDELTKLGFNLTIFTGRPRDDLSLMIDYFNLEKFFDLDKVITLDDCLIEQSNRDQDIQLSKPHPWGINEIKKRNPNSKQFIMVGDSQDDMIASVNANIDSIFVNFNSNRKISHYSNLLGILGDWKDFLLLLNSI